MTVIYEPKGRAREYAELACNLYRGCTHSCDYCYTPGVLRMKAEEFHAAAIPRKGILNNIGKEAKKLSGDPRRVLLCFTCDPYHPGDTVTTRNALQILRDNDIHFEVLTKGGTRAVRDFDLYRDGDAFASTLTCRRDQDSLRHEPGAAIPMDRYAAIEIAKKRDIQTWVSIEPVIDPEQSLATIKAMHEVVDLWKVGKLNHRSSNIDWKRFGHRAVNLMESLGAKYIIKDDLRREMEG